MGTSVPRCMLLADMITRACSVHLIVVECNDPHMTRRGSMGTCSNTHTTRVFSLKKHGSDTFQRRRDPGTGWHRRRRRNSTAASTRISGRMKCVQGHVSLSFLTRGIARRRPLNGASYRAIGWPCPLQNDAARARDKYAETPERFAHIYMNNQNTVKRVEDTSTRLLHIQHKISRTLCT